MGKDEGWKVYFQDNYRCADLINGIGCNGEQVVKPSDLKDEDPTLHKRSRDILRKVALGTSFMIIGIENQEKMDYELALRNMIYDATDYEKQLRKIQKQVRAEIGVTTGEYMYGFKKDSKLKPLATFVLYAGKEPWDGPYCLHDMLDFTDIPNSLKNIVSDYKINIIDIRKFENTNVFRSDLKQVFNFIRYSDDKEKLLNLIENDAYYRAMDKEAYEVVTKYSNSKELVKEKDYTTDGGKKDMCKAIQDLMADSKEEGREEAFLTAARNLLDILSDEVISEKIGLSIQQVQELRETK